MPPTFDRVGLDPRIIDTDLSHLNLVNPGRLFGAWLYVLKSLDIELLDAEYRYLVTLTAETPDYPMYSQGDTRAWLQTQVNNPMARDNMGARLSCDPMDTHTSEVPGLRVNDQEATVCPVMGFWLFPVGAFPGAGEGEEEELKSR
ncbi:hypothetical protein FGRMN_10171 [Fusarium graminum]|nr:hypothetical protein FGRMN_10171 [Fusarium graminum]